MYIPMIGFKGITCGTPYYQRNLSDSKPSTEADGVARMQAEVRRSEEMSKKKFMKRARKMAKSDVSFINKRNQKFNEKAGRYYDKYTAETRAAFERGTAL